MPVKEPKIHAAKVEDVERMVAYGQQFWHQTRYYAAGVDYDVDTVTNMTHALLDEGVVLYAQDGDGEIVALMLVIIAPFPMNMHFLTACEWVFYVDPMYRRGGLGAKLISQAEKILKDRSVKFFTMVSLSNVTPEAANKLYEALGFEQSETNFTKDLSWQP
ncbi:MAG: GNAT family N-acetyltransferase [Rhodospirillales bacterium]